MLVCSLIAGWKRLLGLYIDKTEHSQDCCPHMWGVCRQRAFSVYNLISNLKDHWYIIWTIRDRGWSLDGRRMSVSSYWIATGSQSILVCNFLNVTETNWRICHICHNSLVSIEGSDDQQCQKLFFKSRKITALIFPLSILYAQESVALK